MIAPSFIRILHLHATHTTYECVIPWISKGKITLTMSRSKEPFFLFLSFKNLLGVNKSKEMGRTVLITSVRVTHSNCIKLHGLFAEK
jgi:hypothetical protein